MREEEYKLVQPPGAWLGIRQLRSVFEPSIWVCFAEPDRGLGPGLGGDGVRPQAGVEPRSLGEHERSPVKKLQAVN